MAAILIGLLGSLFCACLVFVYAVAFLIAAQQLVPLVGEHGLTPANHFFEREFKRISARVLPAALQLPSLFWFGISDQGSVDLCLGWFRPVARCPWRLRERNSARVLWAMYMSFVHIGQIWYGYGWEIQLLETGFLSIFLCPLIDGRPFPGCRPPILVFWLFRWLGFRIMIGAGLIKLRGDSCWRDLTCLYYHYETQPIPNSISRYLHFAPHWFHKFGTAWNHFIELVVPWFSFGPRTARHIAGVLLVSFQIVLIISGNLSFLNYVTIIPFLACFDDTFLRHFCRRASSGALSKQLKIGTVTHQQHGRHRIVDPGHLLKRRASAQSCLGPANNEHSYDPFDLVNTYGAFGSVGRERPEIVFEGTEDALITLDTKWKEYEFKAKPGDPNRRPPFIAPYQPESTGKSGSRPWRHPPNTRGHCISPGNFCITIALPFRFWPIIRSPTASLLHSGTTLSL